MKINPRQALKELGGEPLKEQANGVAKEVTLGDVLVGALLAQFPDERNLGGKEKLARYQLAKRIFVGGEEIELTLGELALVKRLVGQAYSSLVSGQVWEILDA